MESIRTSGKHPESIWELEEQRRHPIREAFPTLTWNLSDSQDIQLEKSIKKAIKAIIYSLNVKIFIENLLSFNTMLGIGIQQGRNGHFSHSQKAFILATFNSYLMIENETRA